MLEKFQNHVVSNFLFLRNSKFFIAVSGGIDSMVLVHLFQQIGYPFAMLHCNFQLREKESDEDMKFVMNYGDKFLIPWSVGHFDTKAYAKEMKVSIQIAARELRYDWFQEQLERQDFDYILTAHHLDDNLETFLINLSRGTGLDGLTGIPAQNDKIIRPLLPFSREEIQNYAKENDIKWREDSSNESDKYLRNKIRHNLVPILKEINPIFLDSFQKTQNYLKQAQSIVNDGEDIIYQEVATEKQEGTIHFDLKKLLQMPNYGAYLYQWLKQFEFTAWDDIYALANAQSGKQVFSEHYVLLKNRDFLILSARIDEQENDFFYIEKNQKEVNFPLNISFCNVNDILIANSNCIFVDEEKLIFPLIIRKWEIGDYFYPSGMKGKKKVSKYFKDEKMSLIEKLNQWVLCSEKQIVWVIGRRQDERFKATTITTNIVQITLQ